MAIHNMTKLVLMALLTLTMVGCLHDEDDLGTCTINGSQATVVRENIGLEECQDLFINTVGATRMSWVPNN